MNRKHLSIAQTITLSFLGVILAGAILLTLPISQLPRSQATFLDHLFISVSAVCVTGLFTQPIVHSYTTFGQIIMMLLIQIGGLGFMTLLSFVVLILGKKLTISSTVTVSEALNKQGISDFKSFIISILKYTLVIEGIGFILLCFFFIPKSGLGKGMFDALFVAISAFCNAGFDNFGVNSLINYYNEPLLNLVIAHLIIIGGIGFTVWFDIANQIKSGHFRFSKLMLHTRIVLVMTVLLIFIPMFLTLGIEFNNTNAIGQASWPDKLLMTYFQSVTMRTAGFASVDYTTLHPTTNLIYIIIMFFGGSPGGTAGGIKTSTMALVILIFIHEISEKENISVFKHSIDRELVRKSLFIFVTFVTLMVSSTMIILLFDNQAGLLPVMFETTSALNTVGVSMNLTPTLSRVSQFVLMFLMFSGRIGPMTLLTSMLNKKNKKPEVKYAQGKVLIG